MRRLAAIVFSGVLLTVAPGCSDGPTTEPSPSPARTPVVTTPPPTSSPTPIPSVQSGPITFNGLTGERSPFTTHMELGFTVTPAAGTWIVGANYGNPRPFVMFVAAGGTTATGELQVSGGGATFRFASVDLYASTTPIPYSITGLLNSAPVFTLTGRVPNTFGRFQKVTNPNAPATIDTLKIVLTNAAAPCCTNPMGLDNITLVK